MTPDIFPENKLCSKVGKHKMMGPYCQEYDSFSLFYLLSYFSLPIPFFKKKGECLGWLKMHQNMMQ